MSELATLFTEYGNETVSKLRQSFASKGVNASGRLSRSVESVVTETQNFTSLQVSMFEYGVTSEVGRGPTKNSGPGDLLRRIRQWIDDKGLNIPTNEKEGMAYAITKKIHREGTLQFQKTKATGKGSGAISNVVNEELIDDIISSVADNIVIETADAIQFNASNK